MSSERKEEIEEFVGDGLRMEERFEPILIGYCRTNLRGGKRNRCLHSTRNNCQSALCGGGFASWKLYSRRVPHERASS